uniref:A-kinase anchor protein 7-like phosphoesterase domain-containing protein n=1 Tax=Arion vulgaris TaxID=1028688 RepID=A0A0B6Z9B0_9EUPU
MKIYAVAKKIQAGIQKAAVVDFHKAFVGEEKFHITIIVMHLSNEEEVKKAAESLEKCVPPILERTSGQCVVIDFEGLSSFDGGRVLFASLKATEGLDHLHYIADEVTNQMRNNGIVSTDRPDKEFNPHLTLMKCEGELFRKGIRKVEKRLYEHYVNEVFGAQTINSIQLCNMDKKRADGYYFVEHEVFFNK